MSNLNMEISFTPWNAPGNISHPLRSKERRAGNFALANAKAPIFLNDLEKANAERSV